MKDSPRSDTELKEWLQGTEEQFRKAVQYLYRAEFRKVVYVLKRYKCSEPDAEELFQDALLILAENIGQVEIRKAIPDYIKGICIKKHISRSRKKGLDTVSADAENAPELKDVASELNEMSLVLVGEDPDQEYLRALRESMDQLGKNCREVIENRYLDGFSVAEIAMEAEINPQSVSNKLFRCIKRLREIVEGIPYFEKVLRERL